MAKKEAAITLERTYNVPLRKEFLKVPNWKRTKKAVAALQEFLGKHMKSKDIRLSSAINKTLWEKGIRQPPRHIKVTATKDDKGVVRTELFGLKKEASKETKESKPAAKKEEAQKEA